MTNVLEILPKLHCSTQDTAEKWHNIVLTILHILPQYCTLHTVSETAMQIYVVRVIWNPRWWMQQETVANERNSPSIWSNNEHCKWIQRYACYTESFISVYILYLYVNIRPLLREKTCVHSNIFTVKIQYWQASIINSLHNHIQYMALVDCTYDFSTIQRFDSTCWLAALTLSTDSALTWCIDSLLWLAALTLWSDSLLGLVALTRCIDSLLWLAALIWYFDSLLWLVALTRCIDSLLWLVALTHCFDSILWLIMQWCNK